MKKQFCSALRPVLLLVLVCITSCVAKPFSSDNERNHIVTPWAETELPNPLPGDWLARLNAYRASAGLQPVVEDASLSRDLAKHTQYMLLNPDDIWHGETPGRPGYTPEGHQAASESNLWFTGSDTTATTAIDVWMSSIPHRFGLLNHNLAAIGFAIACDSQHCGTGLNVLRGLQGSNPMPNGVVYPGANQQAVNTDIIISWQFDWHPRVILISASLVDEFGKSIAIKTSSPPPDDYINLVTITPLENLSFATTYMVAMHVLLGEHDLKRAWTFTTAGFRVYLPLIQRHQ
jgi:hypothetical protein